MIKNNLENEIGFCRICKKKFKALTLNHLKTHETNYQSYKTQFPNTKFRVDVLNKMRKERPDFMRECASKGGKVAGTLKKGKPCPKALGVAHYSKEILGDRYEEINLKRNQKIKKTVVERKTGFLNKDFCREAHKKLKTPEVSLKLSDAGKKRWNDMTIQERNRLSLIFSKNTTDYWAKLSKKERKEISSKSSETLKERWKDPDFAQRMFNFSRNSPNIIETFLDGLLQENFPGEWKFVGDGYTWIAGKNPDFLNINGKKAVIEFFGCYWHGCPICCENKYKNNEEERKEHYGKYGFECIIVWEHELKDKVSVLNKIKEFSHA